MSGIWMRGVKILGLFIAAALVVLLADIVIPGDRSREYRMPWNTLLESITGSPGSPVATTEPAVPRLWPIRDGENEIAAVVVAETTGYRSRVILAATVLPSGEVRARRVLRHGESDYVGRQLAQGSLDTITGATVTMSALRNGVEAAQRAARDYFEGQP